MSRVSTPAPTDLRDEVRELRRTVDSLRAALARRSSVTLQADRPRPYLGQPVELTARVTDAGEGKARQGVPVTFTASWGRLRTADGYALREGAALTTRTYPDGTARITLLPPTEEDMTVRQQDALVAGLAGLDPAADAPRDVEQGLETMVRQYRWEANEELRRAVDLLYRAFRGDREAINPHDRLSAWKWLEATVFAHVEAEGSGTAVDASAVLGLRFKDWLDPWLEVHLRLTRAEAGLDRELVGVGRRRAADPAALLDGVYRRVERFVDEQRGLAGRFIGERVGESSMRDFASTGLAEMPRETRLRLAGNLQMASRTVGTAGIQVFRGLGHVQSEGREQVRREVGRIDVERIGGLTGRLEEMEAGLRGKADAAVFESFRDRTSGQLEAKVDQTRFEEELGAKADTEELAGMRQELGRQIADKVDSATFDRQLAGRAEVEALDRLREEVDSSLRNKVNVATFNRFRSETESVLDRKLDVERFDDFEVQTDRRFDGKLDSERFDDLKNAVDDNRRSLRSTVNEETFDSFREETRSALRTKLDSESFDRFKTNTESALDGKVDTSKFDGLKTNLDQNLRSLERRVQGFRVVNPIILDPNRPPIGGGG